LKDSLNSSRNLFEKHVNGIYIVMPAYNESKTIKKVMMELISYDFNLIVIDDGSRDDTYSVVSEILNEYPKKVSLYRHPLNRGLGAAISTGIKAALIHDPEIIITFDADGQHHVYDIFPLCQPIFTNDADVVIGKRNFEEMPFSKRFGNVVMNIITLIFYGKNVGDSQSGLRAFNQKAAQLME